MSAPKVVERTERAFMGVKLDNGTAELIGPCFSGDTPITGDGTLQHPLRAVLTPAQFAAEQMLDVLRTLKQAGGIWPDLLPKVDAAIANATAEKADPASPARATLKESKPTKTPAELWVLGHVIHKPSETGSNRYGAWREVDVKGGHGGFALVVWRMEDDAVRTLSCEARARVLVKAPQLLTSLQAILGAMDDGSDEPTLVEARAVVAEATGSAS